MNKDGDTKMLEKLLELASDARHLGFNIVSLQPTSKEAVNALKKGYFADGKILGIKVLECVE